MSSWQARQTTRVLRRRAAIRVAHSGGWPFPPGVEVFEGPNMVHLDLVAAIA